MRSWRTIRRHGQIGQTRGGPIFFQSVATSALPTLRAGTDPEVLGGQYYGPAGRFDGVSQGRPL